MMRSSDSRLRYDTLGLTNANVALMSEPKLFLAALGEELRYWRNKRGLTLQQLAEDSGVSKATIERAENAINAISVANTEILAEHLEVPLSEMIRRVEDALRIDAAATSRRVVIQPHEDEGDAAGSA